MDEETYVITPKGCACLALVQAGICKSIDDPRIEPFWILFEHYMRTNDYIQEEKSDA